MTITNQDEYKLENGQVISIQYADEAGFWEVACWNVDDSNRWYKEFANEDAARKEFERWRE